MPDRQSLDGQQTFFCEIRAAVNEQTSQYKKLEDFVTMDGDSSQAASIRLSGVAQNWVGAWFSLQVMFTYEEITQRKPHGEIADGR